MYRETLVNKLRFVHYVLIQLPTETIWQFESQAPSLCPFSLLGYLQFILSSKTHFTVTQIAKMQKRGCFRLTRYTRHLGFKSPVMDDWAKQITLVDLLCGALRVLIRQNRWQFQIVDSYSILGITTLVNTISLNCGEPWLRRRLKKLKSVITGRGARFRGDN